MQSLVDTLVTVDYIPIASAVPFTHTSLHGATRDDFEAPAGAPVLNYKRLEVRCSPLS